MAGETDKPAPAKTPKGKPAGRAASAPPPGANVTDKFGLALLVIVCVLLLGNIIVWAQAGIPRGVSLMGLGERTVQDYDLAATQGKILSYGSTGQVGRRAGEVDICVINRGRLDGVRLGDQFKPVTAVSEGGQEYFANFAVAQVNDTSCVCNIITNMSLLQSAGPDTVRLVDKVPAGADVSRKWSEQTVRQKVTSVR